MAQFMGVGGAIKQEPGSALAQYIKQEPGVLTPYSAAMALKPDSIGSYQTAATLSNGLAMVSQATINSLALGAPVGATAASIAGAMAAAAAAAASNGLNNSPGHSPSHQDGSEGHQGGPSSTNGPQNGSGDRGGSPGQGAGQQATDPPPNKLFVGGLSWQTTTDKLRDYFSAFGTVTDVLIMKDPITQRSRGFGFITFQDAMSVDKVLQVTNHSLDGKKIDPKHATPRSAVKKASNEGGMNPNQAATSVAAAAANGTLKTKKIFVGGLSQETTVDEVKQYFTQFGPVEEAVLLMDNQTKRHRGFGFVTMASENAVDRICDIHFHVIKAKKVECKKALPREAVAAATAAAAAAAAAAQQPSLAYLIARQRLAAQAVAANGLVPAGFGGAGVHLGHTSPALLQLYEGLPSSQAAGQAMMQAAPQQGNPNGGNPVVSSAQMSAGVNSQATYGKVLAYQGASSAYRYAPYQLGNPAAAAAALAAAAAANQSQGGHQGMQGGQGPPGYQNYAIPTAVDMSAFQGLDWSAMAGLPAMYAA